MIPGYMRNQVVGMLASTTPPVMLPRVQRPALLRLATALKSRESSLRRDECGDWRIRGRYGHIYAVSPERFQLVFTGAGESAQRWTYAKRQLSFARIAQDGEFDGTLFLDRLPTPNEGKTIRKVLGINKRVEYSEEQLALRRAWASTASERLPQKLPSDKVPATTPP